MRYPASEKLEIIRLVEESALPVRRTLEKVGIPRATFYRWYDLYQAGGPEALDTDIPDQMRLLSPPLCPKPHLSRSRDPSRN
jgi:transposase-like protein